MQVKINDQVEVICGDDRGQRGKVLSVDHKAGTVLIEGINRVYKHVRRSQRNPQGGRLSKEMPIRISNVQLVCQKCGKPTRIGARYLDDGAKERFCRKCGVGLGLVAPPRAAHAKKR